MTITPKTITVTLLVSFLLVAIWMIVNKQSQNSTTPTSTTFPSTQSEGNVTVTVTPLTLKRGSPPIFQLVFETHSVDLSFDVSATTNLTDDKGTLYGVPAWDGSPPGGHHRKGTLTFPTPLRQTTNVVLTLKNVAGIKERTFEWKL